MELEFQHPTMKLYKGNRKNGKKKVIFPHGDKTLDKLEELKKKI